MKEGDSRRCRRGRWVSRQNYFITSPYAATVRRLSGATRRLLEASCAGSCRNLKASSKRRKSSLSPSLRGPGERDSLQRGRSGHAGPPKQSSQPCGLALVPVDGEFSFGLLHGATAVRETEAVPQRSGHQLDLYPSVIRSP